MILICGIFNCCCQSSYNPQRYASISDKHNLDEDVLDHHFRNDFPDCANVIWESGHVGGFGLTLGFEIVLFSIVDVRDLTNQETMPPFAMEMFMMNADFQSVVEHYLDEDFLDHHFCNEFPDCANVIWQNRHVGAFGLILGF